MSIYLGIDTSNYTTSVALYDCDTGIMHGKKLLLPVKKGEKGIRQSDAVFHHTVQLPQLITELFNENPCNIEGVGVSVKPCNEQGSYMPCFLAGVSVAKSVANIMNIPLYEFSHQDGHIAAALFSCGRLDLIDESFIGFHISGGTSQAILVKPNGKYFSTGIISDSLDLKAGQAVDRVGVMLGLDFPCGAELEKIAKEGGKPLKKVKIFRKDGFFSLSGVENQCKLMLEQGADPGDIANHCLSCIYSAIDDTAEELLKKYGDLPLVFSGGVMSNALIKNMLCRKYNAHFAEPQFSADNACGTAVLASICDARK